MPSVLRRLLQGIAPALLSAIVVLVMPAAAFALPYYVAGYATSSQGQHYNSWGTAGSVYWYPSDVLTLSSGGEHVSSIYVRRGDQYLIEVGVWWDSPTHPQNLLWVRNNYVWVACNDHAPGHNCSVGLYNPYTIRYIGGNVWRVWINNEVASDVTNSGFTYGNSMVGSERKYRFDSTHDWNKTSSKYNQYYVYSSNQWIRPTGFTYISTDTPPYSMRYNSATGWLACDLY